MTRPDPKRVARRPMASAHRPIAVSSSRAGAKALGPLFRGARLDVHVLYQLLDAAEAIAEGEVVQTASGPSFYGSVLLKLPQTRHASRLVDALRVDGRAQRVVYDRAFRELARLLGPDTPDDAELQLDVQIGADSALRIDVDIDAPLARTRLKANA